MARGFFAYPHDRPPTSGTRHRTQRLDDPAVGDRAAITGIDHRLQFAAQRGEIGDLAIDLRQMGMGDPVDPGAITAEIVRQIPPGAHLIERETEIERTTAERQPPEFGLPINPLIALRAADRKRARWGKSVLD